MDKLIPMFSGLEQTPVLDDYRYVAVDRNDTQGQVTIELQVERAGVPVFHRFDSDRPRYHPFVQPIPVQQE